MVYRSSGRGATARVTSRSLAGESRHTVRLPLDAFVDGGWYWFDLVAGSGGLLLDEADWSVPADERSAARTGRTTIGITTF